MQPLPTTATIRLYESQAAALLEAWQAGDANALSYFGEHLPRIQKRSLADEVFDIVDARAAIAHGYDFADWESLSAFAGAMARQEAAVYPFELAVDAVVSGDLAGLRSFIQRYPQLTTARSSRVTHFDPPQHRATLLHYVAANGTEGYRQRCPPNAVAIVELLLDAGAEVDALASLYGGECTTLSLLVSSTHPAQAGLQVPLIDLLVARGASLNDTGEGHWKSPIETALVFGFGDAAEALLRHGAPFTLQAAAGLGHAERVRSLLPTADPLSRHRALALAAQSGQVETARLLLEAGEDPNRFNPPGTHAHTPPLHQAIWAGHLPVVRLLIEHGARLDILDTIYGGSPLGWARHAGRTEIVDYLRTLGAQ